MASQTLLFGHDTDPEESCSVCESHLQVAQTLTEVSQDSFFRRLRDDPRDIMPVLQGPYPYRSEWFTKSGTFFGVSVPVSRYKSGQRYFVK